MGRMCAVPPHSQDWGSGWIAAISGVQVQRGLKTKETEGTEAHTERRGVGGSLLTPVNPNTVKNRHCCSETTESGSLKLGLSRWKIPGRPGEQLKSIVAAEMRSQSPLIRGRLELTRNELWTCPGRASLARKVYCGKKTTPEIQSNNFKVCDTSWAAETLLCQAQDFPGGCKRSRGEQSHHTDERRPSHIWSVTPAIPHLGPKWQLRCRVLMLLTKPIKR